MLPKIDLNSLMLFRAVVDAGSLTAVCAATRLSKSTISRRIARLEEEIGALLLKRNTRKLGPTDIGKALYQRCERIAAEVSEAGMEAAEQHSDLRGLLRVSVPSDFGVGWLGHAVAKFSVQHPNIELEMGVNSGEIDLVGEPYDIVIHLGKLPASRLVSRRLAALARGAYASPKYLASAGAPQAVDDLRAHRCIVTELQRNEGVWTLRRDGQRRRVPVKGHITVNNVTLARELAAGGAGIAILPHALCEKHVRNHRLVRVLTGWESPPLQATALILSRDRIPRKVRMFLDFLAGDLGQYEIAR
jgi:DNA-binding transcriptional LysR family regulator